MTVGNFDRHLDLINAIFVIASIIYFQSKHASIMQNTLLDFIIIVSLIHFSYLRNFIKNFLNLANLIPHFDLINMDQRRLLENRRLVVHRMHFEVYYLHVLTYLTPFFSRAQHIFFSDTAHFNHDKKKNILN